MSTTPVNPEPKPDKPVDITRWGSFWRRAGELARALLGAKVGLLIFLSLTLGCAKGEVAHNVGEFVNGFLRPSKPPVVAVQPCCVERGGVHAGHAPGRVCLAEPGRLDADCWHDPEDGCDLCWLHVPPVTATRPPEVIQPTPTETPLARQSPSPVPTATPGAVVTATATPVTPPPVPQPTPFCLFDQGDQPVSIAYFGRCPSYMRKLTWDDKAIKPPSQFGDVACGLNYGHGDHHVARRLEMGTGPDPARFPLVTMPGGAVVQQEVNGRLVVCTDAIGRRFVNCQFLYWNDVPPDYWRNPWTAGSYDDPPRCEDQPTPTPAPTPTPVPTAGPTPTPGGSPRSGACTCQVVCTVAHLGWNDRAGQPDEVHPGGHATVDVTCRQAQHPYDDRGQPVDRSNGPEWCEPDGDPVLFFVDAPMGYKVGNGGYRLDFNDLQVGSYRISVEPRPGATYKNGEPVKVCPWPAGGSVKTVLEFEVR